MEEVIAKEFSQETGLRVRKVSKMYQHPRYEFMIGFIDREVVGENAFLECKNTLRNGQVMNGKTTMSRWNIGFNANTIW